MFKKGFEKLKENFSNGGGDNKKKIENLVVILILLVVTIIAINFIWNEDEPNTDNINNVYKELAVQNEIETEVFSSNSQYELEEKLENILTNMAGVRKSESVNYIFKYK